MRKGDIDVINEVRSKSATLILGRSGVTDEFVEEVKKQLKRKRVIKIRALKSVLSEKSINELGSDIAMRTKSRLLEIRGYTLLLSRGHF